MKFLYNFPIIVSLLLPGCAPALLFSSGLKMGSSSAEERGLGGVISDTALKNTISYRLLRHSIELFSKVSVSVHQGQALVTGVVDTPQLKSEALRIIKGVGGIKRVIDEVTVARLSLAQIGIDGWITTHLTSTLAIDPDIQSINYEIKTENGVVYITGIAQNKEELTRVTEKARNIDKVKKVISHVKLKDTPMIPHSEITEVQETSGTFIDNTPITVTEVNELPAESPLAGLD